MLLKSISRTRNKGFGIDFPCHVIDSSCENINNVESFTHDTVYNIVKRNWVYVITRIIHRKMTSKSPSKSAFVSFSCKLDTLNIGSIETYEAHDKLLNDARLWKCHVKIGKDINMQ